MGHYIPYLYFRTLEQLGRARFHSLSISARTPFYFFVQRAVDDDRHRLDFRHPLPNAGILLHHCFIPLFADEAVFVAIPHAALVRIVLPQQQAVLGARGKHSIRLLRSLRNEIVDEHANIRLRSFQYNRVLPHKLSRGVDSRNQALPRRLLVSRRAIDLARMKQSLKPLCLQ